MNVKEDHSPIGCLKFLSVYYHFKRDFFTVSVNYLYQRYHWILFSFKMEKKKFSAYLFIKKKLSFLFYLVIINESCYKKEEIRKYNYNKKNKKSGSFRNKVFTKQTKREVRYNVTEQNGGKVNRFVQTSLLGKNLPSANEGSQDSRMQTKKRWEVSYNVTERNGGRGNKFVHTSLQGNKLNFLYEGTQDCKLQAQNSCVYYGNSRNCPEMRVFSNDYQNEDCENYYPQFMAIPSAITFSPTPTLNEKDRVIDSLKGQIQAYKEILKHQKKENFSSKINLACEKMRSAMRVRQTLKPFIEDDNVISNAINFILGNTSLYEDCELQIKRSATLLEQGAENYQEMLIQLNIENVLEHKRELTYLKEKLETVHEEARSSSLFNEVNRENVVIPTESKLGQDFISWKNEYLKLQSSSDKMVEDLCFSLEECASLFRNLIKGVGNEEVTQFNFEHSEHALQMFSDEITHSEKMNVIPSTCIELLKEIKARIAKINNVEIAVKDVSKLNSQLPNKSCVMEEENHYPTLLNFANLSRILPYLKYSITRDIFHSLSNLHTKDAVYVYLSPQNVLISGGGAVLCSADTVSTEEPIPDFNFFSPETNSCNSLEPLTANLSCVNPAADYYSLGRIIIWLSGKGLNENFLEHEINIMRRFPFIEKLVSMEPKERPSFFEFKEFMNLLSDLYYTSDFTSPIMKDHSAANVLENSFETGSDLSTLSIASKFLDEERNLIYKETEDSDIDSEDDDNDEDDDDDDDESDNETLEDSISVSS